VVLENHQIGVDDLPDPEDEAACRRYNAKLCRAMYPLLPFGTAGGDADDSTDGDIQMEDSEWDMEVEDIDDGSTSDTTTSSRERGNSPDVDLGGIGLESLTTMISRDDLQPGRRRRHIYFPYLSTTSSVRFPPDPLAVGRWIKDQFGSKHSITAIFLTHAVINQNTSILHTYLCLPEIVPITLKHFRILARLGRTPNYYMYEAIRQDAPFYVSEEDYIPRRLLKYQVKGESGRTASSVSSSPVQIKSEPSESITVPPASPKRRKRPRRSAVSAVSSYAVPDSDDEAIVAEDAQFGLGASEKKKKQIVVESSLERWIKALGELLKEEQKKYKEKKKRAEMVAEPGAKVRVNKSDFLKSLSQILRDLRELETAKRVKLYGPDHVFDTHSSGEDDEYVLHRTRNKRRKAVSKPSA